MFELVVMSFKGLPYEGIGAISIVCLKIRLDERSFAFLPDQVLQTRGVKDVPLVSFYKMQILYEFQ